jgi:hypothetical protein
LLPQSDYQQAIDANIQRNEVKLAALGLLGLNQPKMSGSKQPTKKARFHAQQNDSHNRRLTHERAAKKRATNAIEVQAELELLVE